MFTWMFYSFTYFNIDSFLYHQNVLNRTKIQKTSRENKIFL